MLKCPMIVVICLENVRLTNLVFVVAPRTCLVAALMDSNCMPAWAVGTNRCGRCRSLRPPISRSEG